MNGQLDYTLGMKFAACAGCFVGPVVNLVCFVSNWIIGFRIAKRLRGAHQNSVAPSRNTLSEPLGGPTRMFLSTVSGLGFALMVFPVANLVAQHDIIGAQHLVQELQSGNLSLRFASLLVGYYSVANALLILAPHKSAGWRWLVVGSRLSPKREPEPLDSLPPACDQEALDYGAAALSGVFAAAAASLWLFAAMNVHSWATALMSWMLLFIVDDWAIIRAYAARFKGLCLRSHSRRIDLVHAGLVIMMVLTWWIERGWRLLIVALIVLVLFEAFYLLPRIVRVE
jgi:hypothetical protein